MRQRKMHKPTDLEGFSYKDRALTLCNLVVKLNGIETEGKPVTCQACLKKLAGKR